ncbi:MAG TPA: hypothetical protein VIH03_07170 [Nitrososphaerales archaeon]
MQHRIRSKWASVVLPIVILQLLKEGGLDEWKVMDSLYRLFGSALNEKDAQQVIKVLISEGFVEVSKKTGSRELQVNKEGLRLLSELLEKYETTMTEAELEV